MSATSTVALMQGLRRPAEIPPLTGLRIVGAAWVALFHFQTTLYAAWPGLVTLKPILNEGHRGVPLFFVLSGFVIWHNYGSKELLGPRASASFMWRRFARLWPVNVLTAALAIPLMYIVVNRYNYWGLPIPDWYSVGGWLRNAFMMQELGNPEVVYQWNQPAWSLTGEMIAYVVFPLLVLMLLPFPKGIGRYRGLWFVAGFIVMYVEAFRIPAGVPYGWLITLLAAFISGALVRISGPPSRQALPVVEACQFLAPVVIVYACFSGHSQLINVALLLWVYSLSVTSGIGGYVFGLKAMQIAGFSSYSLYMLHWLIFMSGTLLLLQFPRIQQDYLQAYAATALALVAVTSWASWRYFETPCRRWMNRLFDRAWPRRDAGKVSGELRARTSGASTDCESTGPE